MIKVDEEKLLKIKEEAKDNFVPILRDDTMKIIEKKLDEIKPNKILEVGTAVGYSAITFAKHLEEGSIIDTIERNEKRFETAKKNINEMGLENVINIMYGDAKEIMKTLNDTYDVVFIDAAKGQYLVFLEEAKRLVKNGGWIIADNVLWQGLVKSDYNEHRNRTAVKRLREFLRIIEEDKEFESEVIDIDDGLALINVKKQ